MMFYRRMRMQLVHVLHLLLCSSERTYYERNLTLKIKQHCLVSALYCNTKFPSFSKIKVSEQLFYTTAAHTVCVSLALITVSLQLGMHNLMGAQLSDNNTVFYPSPLQLSYCNNFQYTLKRFSSASARHRLGFRSVHVTI